MCGIFGGIGQNVNVGTIRALALINRERGTDSLGFFNSNGKILKLAGDPLDCLGRAEFAGYLKNSARDGWFVAGHTRYATMGSVTTRNAHPFQFGSIIGTHNGCVTIPRNRNYSVDSEYLFDQLNRHNGDYQRALADISGYWGLAWFDGDAFYLQAHENKVALGRAADGVWYYSSDATHLAACIDARDGVTILQTGATVRFTRDKERFQVMPDFQSSAAKYVRWTDTSRAGGGGRKKSAASMTSIGYKAPTKYSAPAAKSVPAAKSAPAVPAASSVYDEYANMLSGHAWSDFERLAREAGYKYPEDFMGEMGFSSEREAYAFIKQMNSTDSSEKAAVVDDTDWLVDDELNDFEDLLTRTGYLTIEEFMESEGIHDEREAYEYLKDALFQDSGNWTDIDPDTGEFTGSDSVDELDGFQIIDPLGRDEAADCMVR